MKRLRHYYEKTTKNEQEAAETWAKYEARFCYANEIEQGICASFLKRGYLAGILAERETKLAGQGEPGEGGRDGA